MFLLRKEASKRRQMKRKLVGVDGCKSGWVVAEADEDLHTVTFTVFSRFGDIIQAFVDSGAVIGVDMPIGLSDNDARACDRAARQYLGSPRNNSVFSAPCRSALDAADYADACRLNLLARGKALSRQSFGILPKIRDIDLVMTPARQDWIREVHPEVTFAALSGRDRGLANEKKTLDGEKERLALLPGALARVNPAAEVTRLRPEATLGRDDVVDALACLATAARIASGESFTLPFGTIEKDARGLRMEIVA